MARLPHLVDAGHRVVTLDHRGCGLSDKDFDDMSINAIAGDVAALVAELGLTKGHAQWLVNRRRGCH